MGVVAGRLFTPFNVATAWTPWKTRRAMQPLSRPVVPSMWPRLGRRGRRKITASGQEGIRALQCGHGLDAVEDGADQGEPRVDRLPSMWPRLGRRGRLERGRVAERPEGPSMWPRLGRRGRPCNTPSSTIRIASFNVATAWTPWKTPPPPESILRRVNLQCGHGLDAVEDGQGMSDTTRDTPILQCGHGLEAVEDWHPSGQIAACEAPFNVATAWTPWKTTRSRPRAARLRPFNVATAWTPWKTRAIRRWPGGSATFNVATAWTPWKTAGVASRMGAHS